MPLTDLSLADCRAYRPELPVPDGFDAFWSSTLSEVSADGRGSAEKPVFAPVDTGLTQVRTYDVTLPGFAGRPVRGWLHLLGRGHRTARLHRRVPRIRTWARPRPREPPLGVRRLRALDHGHPWSGLVGRDRLHRRYGRRCGRYRARFPHPWHREPRNVLLPTGVHRRRALRRGDARAPGGRSRPDRRHRGQPGRRHRPGRIGARAGAGRGDAGRAVPLQLPAGGGDFW